MRFSFLFFFWRTNDPHDTPNEPHTESAYTYILLLLYTIHKGIYIYIYISLQAYIHTRTITWFVSRGRVHIRYIHTHADISDRVYILSSHSAATAAVLQCLTIGVNFQRRYEARTDQTSHIHILTHTHTYIYLYIYTCVCSEYFDELFIYTYINCTSHKSPRLFAW